MAKTKQTVRVTFSYRVHYAPNDPSRLTTLADEKRLLRTEVIPLMESFGVKHVKLESVEVLP